MHDNDDGPLMKLYKSVGDSRVQEIMVATDLVHALSRFLADLLDLPVQTKGHPA